MPVKTEENIFSFSLSLQQYWYKVDCVRQLLRIKNKCRKCFFKVIGDNVRPYDLIKSKTNHIKIPGKYPKMLITRIIMAICRIIINAEIIKKQQKKCNNDDNIDSRKTIKKTTLIVTKSNADNVSGKKTPQKHRC